MEQLLKKLLTY